VLATGIRRESGMEKSREQKHYRIFKQNKMVSLDELTEKLSPIIEGLVAEGKKTWRRWSANVAMLAAKLKRLLVELAE